ncbi:Uncharacterised protein [Mycobacteroides abscessus subsp. abscessus]|nr:Uncharacterised protein [Mycobacteroides abscessus subsp. abscessus]
MPGSASVLLIVEASNARSCQLASQLCSPVKQCGSSSCAATTGVMPSVSRFSRPSAASARNTLNSGRYAADQDWYSHSSPTGQRPWLASHGRCVCSTSVKSPGTFCVTESPQWQPGPGSRRYRAHRRRQFRNPRWSDP